MTYELSNENILSWLQLLVAGIGKSKMKKLHAIALSITLIVICIKVHLSAADESRDLVRPAVVAGMF